MVKSIEHINEYILSGRADKLIAEAESFHEKQYQKLINEITENSDVYKVICIAGPSSSGKTIFTNTLMRKIRAQGMDSMVISMDNYFIDKSKIEPDEFGKYDFESVDIIDTELFNSQINSLICGEKVHLSEYSFFSGKKKFGKNAVSLGKNGIIFIEGIHALNYDTLFSGMDKKNMYGIYISPEDSYKGDGGYILQPHQIRLIRRIVRDSCYRNCGISGTLNMWDSVRVGEYKYIYPYRKNAQFCFNSSLEYELPVLKKYFDREYMSAGEDVHRLCEKFIDKKILEEFSEISSDIVPQASILNEFIPKTF